VYKLKKECKRLYRCFDAMTMSMKYPDEYYSVAALMRDYEFHDDCSVLMEGVEVSGRNVYCGDILVDCNQSGIYVCEQNEFGELSLGLCLPGGLQYIMTSTLISKFCFTSVYIAGNIYQNPELLETGGEKCTS